MHRVRHLGWGIDMAVKSPRPELFDGPGDQALFVREAEAWVSLGLHPHVCACHYVRVVGGVPTCSPSTSRAAASRSGSATGGSTPGAPGRPSPASGTRPSIGAGLEHAHRRASCTRT
ncbi:hypothetical protein [Streptomyces sp. KL116D]|uniref:hypothetical protein n=1 Tax=Streptomyces sp. KL116D TaxID=3045152 RepID=UPI003557B4B3